MASAQPGHCSVERIESTSVERTDDELGAVRLPLDRQVGRDAEPRHTTEAALLRRDRGDVVGRNTTDSGLVLRDAFDEPRDDVAVLGQPVLAWHRDVLGSLVGRHVTERGGDSCENVLAHRHRSRHQSRKDRAGMPDRSRVRVQAESPGNP